MSSVEEFRTEIRAWLLANLTGEFADPRGRGGPGRKQEAFAERLAWERHLAAAGWTCVGWPKEYGGRGAPLEQQVAFHEEYALADVPARVNHVGEQLLGRGGVGDDGAEDLDLPRARGPEWAWRPSGSTPCACWRAARPEPGPR